MTGTAECAGEHQLVVGNPGEPDESQVEVHSARKIDIDSGPCKNRVQHREAGEIDRDFVADQIADGTAQPELVAMDIDIKVAGIVNKPVQGQTCIIVVKAPVIGVITALEFRFQREIGRRHRCNIVVNGIERDTGRISGIGQIRR